MDPASIAAAAVALLTPFAKRAGEELVKTVGEVAVDKVKALLGWIKQQLSGDAAAAKDVSRFEANPEKFGPVLEDTLKEKMAQDPRFAAELKKLMDEVGPLLVVNQKVKDATNVVGAEGELVSGKVSVNQEAERVASITGFKGTIG
jgi:hypothetical protein